MASLLKEKESKGSVKRAAFYANRKSVLGVRSINLGAIRIYDVHHAWDREISQLCRSGTVLFLSQFAVTVEYS